jgi:hypothetical protein
MKQPHQLAPVMPGVTWAIANIQKLKNVEI